MHFNRIVLQVKCSVKYPSSKPRTSGLQYESDQVMNLGNNKKNLGEYFDSYGADAPLVFRNY